jgi:hypothetical protein
VDLYPTLAELAGLPSPIPTELGVGQGTSLAPVFHAPDASHATLKQYAFSQYPRCGGGPPQDAHSDCNQVVAAKFTTMGYSVRDNSWRYTEWKLWDGKTLRPVWTDTVASELRVKYFKLKRDFCASLKQCSQLQSMRLVCMWSLF